MGYYDLANTYLNIIVPVICIAIWAGILRFIFDFNDEKGKYKVIFNAMLVFAGASAIYTLGTVVLGFTADIKMLVLIYIMGLFTMLQNCYAYAARGLGYNNIFALSGIVGGVVNGVSNIVMILVFHMNESSLFIALSLGLLAQVIVMETKVKMMKHFSLKLYDKQLMFTMVKYSAPLAFNSACYWFLSSYNRIGISNILGLDANGIYSIAGKYTYVLGLVSNCFTMAMQELLYSMGNDKTDKSKTYTIMANYYVKGLMYGLLLLMPVVYFSFPILIGKDYQAAFSLIPLYLLATVYSIFCSFLGDIFAAEKQTWYVFTTTILPAIVNFGLFHLLVGTLGIQAANISLLCGFVVMTLCRVMGLRKSIKISLDIKSIVFTTVLFALSFWIYMTQGNLVNAVAFVVYLGLAVFAFRDVIKQGIQFLKSRKTA